MCGTLQRRWRECFEFKLVSRVANNIEIFIPLLLFRWIRRWWIPGKTERWRRCGSRWWTTQPKASTLLRVIEVSYEYITFSGKITIDKSQVLY